MEESKKRISWLDMAKGYGILFVILGHLDIGLFDEWIYTFHMPLFFFLSGCVFSAKKPFLEFLKKKCKALLVPYFCMGLLVILFQFLFYSHEGESLSGDLLLKFRDLLVQIRCWDLWYLACLFWMNIIFYWIVRIFKRLWATGLVILLMETGGVYYYTYVRQGVFWNIDACFIVGIFFYLGYLFRELFIGKFTEMKLKAPLAVGVSFLALIINLVSAVYSYKISGLHFDIYDASLGFVPLSFISAVAGIVPVLILSKQTYLYFIDYIGKNSLIYYILHMDVMIPVTERLLGLAGFAFAELTVMQPAFWLCRLYQFIFIVASLTLISELFKRTPLRVLTGR